MEEDPNLVGPALDDGANPHDRRPICWSGCGRPSSVCLCPHLPSSPLPTATTLLVLHHPHQLRRNPLATLPILRKSLHNCLTISGRRLRPESHPLLASPQPSALYLFPGGEDLAVFAAKNRPPPNGWLLITFDATWRQAREMVAASLPFLDRVATRVSLGGVAECLLGAAEGPSSFESDLVLRKEPAEGCVSTVEAVARALGALEPGAGEAAESVLLGALRAMVRFQASHLKPMKPRPKLRKKKKEEEKDGDC